MEKIFSLPGNGTVERFEGNYSYYAQCFRQRPDEGTAAETGSKAADQKEGAASEIKMVKKDRPLKFTYKEQKEYEQIDGLIAGLERQIGETDALIDAAAADFEKLQTLLSEKEHLEKRLEEAMERWVYLNELADAIAKQQQ